MTKLRVKLLRINLRIGNDRLEFQVRGHDPDDFNGTLP